MKTLLLAVFLFACHPAHCFERIALIIGNNFGLAEDTPLQFATEDAKSLHATLTELGGIVKGRSYLLLNPNKAKVLSTFQEILGRTKEIRLKGDKTLLFLYYSGHGDPGSFHLGGESLKLDEVRAFFSQVDADIKVLIADACHSGALIRSKGATLGDPIPLDFSREVDARGSVILTSSSASELSRESQELQGSVFTHHLVSGLRGGADHDRDGQVSLQEGYEYARLQIAHSASKHPSLRNVAQNPQYDFDLRGSTPLILTELARGSARLRLAGLSAGEYTLFRDRRNAMASLRLGANDTIELSLPKGIYLVRRSAVHKVYLAEVDLNWSKRAELTPKHFAAYPVDILNAKGSQPLTYRPWQVFLEQETATAFPDNLAWMFWTSIGMRHQWEDISLAVSGGWIFPHTLETSEIRMRRSGYSLSVEGRYSLFERSQFLVFTGAMARHWTLETELRRADEIVLQNAGYHAIPDQEGTAWNGAMVMGVDLRLPASWEMGLHVRPGCVFWKSSAGQLESAWRTAFGLSAGYRF